MDELLRPFTFEFFRNGLAVAVVAGALCAAVGCWVVLRSMAYIGHGLSHAVLAGFALATIGGVGPLVGAAAWGLASALAVTRVTRRAIGRDATIAIVTTTSFALGLALLQWHGAERDADAVLFGNVLGVSTVEVGVVVAVAAAVAAVLALRYRALLFVAFDPEVAAASGVAVGRLDALLMVLLTVTVLTSMSILGVTLVAAAIVTPAATARLLTSSFTRLLGLAVAIGAAGAFVGMVAGYHLDVAPGPTIVLVDGAAFVAAYLATARR